MEQQDLHWLADSIRDLSDRVSVQEARLEDLEEAIPALRRLERQLARMRAARTGWIREYRFELVLTILAIGLSFGLASGAVTPSQVAEVFSGVIQ